MTLIDITSAIVPILLFPFQDYVHFKHHSFHQHKKLWNELNNKVRSSQSLSQFKNRVRKQSIKVPDFHLLGDRKINIQLTRLRHRCSSLNADLYNVNIIPNSAGVELNFSQRNIFFFDCNLYNIQRQRLIQSINPNLVIDFTLLTNGSPICKCSENVT